MSHSVATLEALGPLPPVEPLPSALHAQSVALSILPVAFEVTPAVNRENIIEGGGGGKSLLVCTMNILVTNSEFYFPLPYRLVFVIKMNLILQKLIKSSLRVFRKLFSHVKY